MTKRIQDIKNYWFPTDLGNVSRWEAMPGLPGAQGDERKNLTFFIAPIQFQRIKHDIAMWREAMTEAELAFFPQRVKMQRMFLDTALNEHVSACCRARKRLTMLRDFKICSIDGTKEDLVAKELFKNIWFRNAQNHILNAIFFGYSLINLGDIVNNAFPKLDLIRRHNVSPDRLNVTAFVYSLAGINFLEEPYCDWHIWVPTPVENGIERCGYGLFYEIAKTEILLRNNTGYNADYQEVFGQPIRVGKTFKTDETERGQFESSLRNMGSQSYILLDDGQDDLQLIESKNTGQAFQSYADFEKRMEDRITKVILGHADSMSSTPGKLGGEQGGMNSPSQIALKNIQSEDGTFVEMVINSELIPRMQKFGLPIPQGYRFEYINNEEKEIFRSREDASNKVTADIAYQMHQAGMKMDAQYFQDRTGIPTTDMPTPVPMALPGIKPKEPDGLKEETKNRLKKFYSFNGRRI